MRLRVLGAAAGGGFPQWNCACANCQAARTDCGNHRRLLHSSLAFSANGRGWHLVNATPDVRHQIESFPALHAGPAARSTPVRGIFLTDAELDHTLGLLQLREGASLDVYATRGVIGALHNFFPVAGMVKHYADYNWVEIPLKRGLPLDDGRVYVSAVPMGCKRPRYVELGEDDPGWVVALVIEDMATGSKAVYAPAIGSWTPELAEACAEARCIFADGTFWSEDELAETAAAGRTASAMGHLPLGGQGGLAEKLAAAGPGRKILVHINNTNPILSPSSAERTRLSELGIEVGEDGLEVEI